MSSQVKQYPNTLFHRIKAVSLNENESTLSESEFSEEIYNSTEESQLPHPKIPAFATHKHKDSEEINSALWKAAQQGKHEVCEELLSSSFYCEYKADINYPDCKKWTPLHIAAFSGHIEVCKLLLSHKETLNIDSLTEGQSTALHLACGEGHLEIAHLLVKNGAKVSLKDANSDSLLHVSARKGHFKVVSWLLLVKIDNYWVNKEGKTAEDVAVGSCKRLLEQYREIQEIKVENYMNVQERTSFPPFFSQRVHRSLSLSNNPFQS